MKDLVKDLNFFNKKYGLPDQNREMLLDEDWLEFRLQFLREELNEITSAVYTNDVPGLLDGLIDLIYVAVGTGTSLGLPMEEAWQRVHEANLRKVRVDHPEQSKRGHKFDLVKPKGWKAPIFEDIL